MRFAAFVPVFCALVAVTQCAPAAATPKQTFIANLKKLVTGFFTDAQLSTLSDALATDVINIKTGNVAAENLYKNILAMKDPARVNKFKAAWKKVVTQIGGDAPAKAAYGKITAVFTERLGPINKQVQAAVKKAKASGAKPPALKDIVYGGANKAFTQANIANLLKLAKQKLTAKEWNAITKNMYHNGLRFKQYGY
ncbi:hypothetical protein AAVH_36609 [Aphelenchoides avenae]|nr:hypothetical protein AAVH_36609 [Aphelenchus avenae]